MDYTITSYQTIYIIKLIPIHSVYFQKRGKRSGFKFLFFYVTELSSTKWTSSSNIPCVSIDVSCNLLTVVRTPDLITLNKRICT